MSPYLIQSAAKGQIEDRLRSAERHGLAAQARAGGSASAARPSGRRLRLRSLRVVFA